ncbi:MAG: sigma-E processing peptidase SpoIIGA [Bacillota bacterium]
MGYTVYVDEMFFGNLVMNYAILWLTACIGQRYARWWRLLPAAGIGALYAFSIVLPVPAMVQWFPAKVTVSMLILWVAFGPLPLTQLLLLAGLFYLASFGLGGLVLGFSFLLGGGGGEGVAGLTELPREHFWPAVALSLVAVWLVGKKATPRLRQRFLKGLLHVPLTITLFGRQKAVNALLDTGNELVDPLTRHPVIVAEYAAINELLPRLLRELYEKETETDFAALLETLREHRWATRFRLVPYRSLGQSGGLLLGFRPDRVDIVYGSRTVQVRDVVVAIYSRQLSPEATYKALVNPRLLACAAYA